MAEDQAIPKTTAEDNQTQEADGELKAMNVIVEALKPLSDQQRRRALDYVAGRFGVLPAQPPTQPQSQQAAADRLRPGHS
jgi:FtsZ-interacting cell division protein YlmF